MRWRIIAVGKARLPFAREGIAEYIARLRCFATVELETVRSANPEREGIDLLSRSDGCFRLVLDERGRQMTSQAFSEEIRRIELNPRKRCAIIVGGADGLSQPVRDAADLLWSLSPLTLQHELALLLALEQVYRGHTILAGIPYHRN